ncbi:MAG: hypothetical protein ABIJ20_03610 [Nanoarchaeota archaeon]|nr:hypothetical protein [Nanoarchaeota archaeon]MBU1444766.1 hypothetical protein [Nanoarchaeota archaeon]MBU2474895.1 hypothetical protein [Nanoarchaeota archaeon]
MKKIYLIFIITVLLTNLIAASECCPDCETSVKVTAKMQELEVSHDHSVLLIYGRIKNKECAVAENVFLKLNYKPNDYEMGPEITVFPFEILPMGYLMPYGSRPYFFIVELDHYFPYGPVEPGDSMETKFYVSAHGSNFNKVKSKVMSFIPKEEDTPIEIEEEIIEKEPIEEETKEPIKETPISKTIEKVDLNKVKLFN